jgi:hypothetical protein
MERFSRRWWGRGKREEGEEGGRWRENMALLLQSEIAENVSGQVLVDFAVPRHRLLLASPAVHIDVVIAAGTKEDAALLLKPAKEFTPFHAMATSRI